MLYGSPFDKALLSEVEGLRANGINQSLQKFQISGYDGWWTAVQGVCCHDRMMGFAPRSSVLYPSYGKGLENTATEGKVSVSI